MLLTFVTLSVAAITTISGQLFEGQTDPVNRMQVCVDDYIPCPYSGIVLDSCSFIDCTSTKTSGVVGFEDAETVRVIDSTFKGCWLDWSPGKGGGLALVNVDDSLVDGCRFENCTGYNGGGIGAFDSLLTLRSTEFIECTCKNEGAGLRCESSGNVATVDMCNFVGCSCEWGWGMSIALIGMKYADITRTTIDDKTKEDVAGSVLYVSSCDSCDFSNIVLTVGYRNGVGFLDVSTWSIINSSISFTDSFGTTRYGIVTTVTGIDDMYATVDNVCFESTLSDVVVTAFDFRANEHVIFTRGCISLTGVTDTEPGQECGCLYIPTDGFTESDALSVSYTPPEEPSASHESESSESTPGNQESHDNSSTRTLMITGIVVGVIIVVLIIVILIVFLLMHRKGKPAERDAWNADVSECIDV